MANDIVSAASQLGGGHWGSALVAPNTQAQVIAVVAYLAQLGDHPFVQAVATSPAAAPGVSPLGHLAFITDRAASPHGTAIPLASIPPLVQIFA